MGYEVDNGLLVNWGFVAPENEDYPREVVIIGEARTSYVELVKDQVDMVDLLRYHIPAGYDRPCYRLHSADKGWGHTASARAIALAEGSPDSSMEIEEAWVAGKKQWRRASLNEIAAIAAIYDVRARRIGWDFVREVLADDGRKLRRRLEDRLRKGGLATLACVANIFRLQ